MNLVPGSTKLTEDGVVGTSGNPIRIFAVHLVSGASASTTTFNNGAAVDSEAYLQVDGVISKGVTVNIAGGLRFPAGCYMNTDANITYCTIVYTEEM